MAIQHLTSSTANKRPTPAAMADAQIAINSNTASPGLFFKDSAGALIKVGPVHVGSTAPNASPASGGQTGNAVGEQWLDTSGSTYVFKVWDGTAWRSETGTFVDVNGDTMTGALGVIAGSASTPGLYISGDTNTGIYSPGADQLAISTNSSQRLLIDASGNVNIDSNTLYVDATNNRVGLRTSAPAAPLVISNGGAEGWELGYTSGTTELIGYNRSTSARAPMKVIGQTFLVQTGNPSLSNGLYQDSSGRVGIGTTSPSHALDIVGDLAVSQGSRLYLTNNSGFSPSITNTADANSMQFYQANTERMRIDSSGKLLIGTSSQSGGSLLQVNDNRIRIATAKTPASATDTGVAGEICWDANYVYVCTATNTWKRTAISTW